jgi:hypothetical protein
LFVIAGAEVPAVTWRRRGSSPGSALHPIGDAVCLSPADVWALRELAWRIPPEQQNGQAIPSITREDRSPPAPGGVLIRLLANRRLAYSGGYVIWGLTGRLMSAATSRSKLSRRTASQAETADYAATLDISPADLTFVTGLELPAPAWPPAMAEAARLLWDIRNLSEEQLRPICEAARARRSQGQERAVP